MDVAVIGVNHNTAPIRIREKVSFTDTKKIEGINYLLDHGIKEVVILSTCNRSEIYIHSDNIESKIHVLKAFYEDFFDAKGIKEFLFDKMGKDALIHLYNVSSGLDSIVLGEDQILGQVKDSHQFSMELGASGKILNKLFREAITTAKDIKSSTKISEHPLSISYIGVKFLKNELETLENKNVLIIGVGKMSKLTLNHLQEEKVNKIYLANRNYYKCLELKKEYKNLIPIEYENRYDILGDVDIVISATASPHTVLKTENMPNINKPLFIMDIALPRDVEESINELANIYVYDIDDLKKISNENDRKRREIAMTATNIIDDNITEFIDWMKTIKVDPTIKSLNERCLDIEKDTLDYIYRKVSLNKKEEKIMEKMLSSALKRLIREPITKLKEIKDEGKRDEYIKVIEDLFDL